MQMKGFSSGGELLWTKEVQWIEEAEMRNGTYYHCHLEDGSIATHDSGYLDRHHEGWGELMGCTTCNGTGWIVYKSHGQWDGEYCVDCIEKGVCPQCGAELPETEPPYQCECGWDSNMSFEEAVDEWCKPPEIQEIQEEDDSLWVMPDSKRRRGRVEKHLSQQWRFDEGVMTLKEYLEMHDITHKRARRRYYKRRGVGPLANPVTTYAVWWGDKGLGVPKVVYDALDVEEEEMLHEVPEKMWREDLAEQTRRERQWRGY